MERLCLIVIVEGDMNASLKSPPWTVSDYSGTILNNNAESCYDCMIPEVTAIHLQALGLLKNATKISVLLNKNAKHNIETAAGGKPGERLIAFQLAISMLKYCTDRVADACVDDTDNAFVDELKG
eukprot:181337-Ditylum_brightwellii.AAC.1